VNVPVDGRKPLGVKESGDDLGLLQRQSEPVTIVIVSCVPLVKFRKRCSLVGSFDDLVVPVNDPVESVWIDGGNDDGHHLVADAGPRLGFGGGEFPGEGHRHLGSGDLGRMHVAGDEDDGDRLIEQRFRRLRRKTPGICDSLAHRLDRREPLQVFWRRDDAETKGSALGGGPHMGGGNRRMLLAEVVEPAADGVPIGQLKVGAGWTLEPLFRRLDLGTSQ